LWKPDSFFYGCFFDLCTFAELSQMKWENLKITSCVFFFCAFGWIEVKSRKTTGDLPLDQAHPNRKQINCDISQYGLLFCMV
jgi:hypothetical protein